MGVDAEINATGDLTMNLNSRFKLPDVDSSSGEHYFDTEDERYYGPGYTRGDWPKLYQIIREAQAVLPNATIYYRSDHDDNDNPGHECTPEYLESLWTLYLSDDGDEYHNRRA